MHQNDLEQRINDITSRIKQAAERVGRSADEICLIAVSKTFDVEDIKQVYELGLRDFGESYVQEWQDKVSQLPEDIRWHFIGHIQSNKIKYFEDHAHLIHGVDRSSVIKALKKHNDHNYKVLLQVNVGQEDQKSGADPASLEVLLEKITALENVSLLGLMTVPPYHNDSEKSRPYFKQLKQLQRHAMEWLESRGLLEQHPCSELSMGMSGDFEVAIEEGATMVRVGSAIFGQRDYFNA